LFPGVIMIYRERIIVAGGSDGSAADYSSGD
jgi:hypothetical protein